MPKSSYYFSERFTNWVLRTLLIFATLLVNECLSFTEVNVDYPATTMDYKINIEAGKEDCVYQYTQPGSVFYVDFHVIRGGDGFASFSVKDPSGQVVLPYEWKEKATYEISKSPGGIYTICIDNQYSKFSAKLVSVYMTSYSAEGWDRFAEDINQIDMNTELFFKTFAAISKRITDMLQHLQQSKSQEARDFALLKDNNYNVSFWSIVFCSIVLGSGCFHVYMIRQLFRDAPSHGNYKVRL